MDPSPMRRTGKRYATNAARNAHFVEVVGRFPLTAFASALMSPLRKTAPYGPPVHRLGDCAGRFPGSRVVAQLRPAFPVSQWPYGRGLAAYSCGGSHGMLLIRDSSNAKYPCSLFRPRCYPENQHGQNFLWNTRTSQAPPETAPARPAFSAIRSVAQPAILALAGCLTCFRCFTCLYLAYFTCFTCFTCLTCLR